jgi:hypothetical protein
MTVHIGVTGHRHLADRPAVIAAVDTALDQWCPVGHADPVVIISGLAEGADRLVVDRVLARAPAALHAILPLPAEDYALDFPRTESEFAEYLAVAAVVDVSRPTGTERVEAYEAAGRAMVHGSDVVLALWDQRPAEGRAGTAEIVDYAREHGVPVVVVPVERALETPCS